MAGAAPWEASARQEAAKKFANHFKSRGISSESVQAMHPSILAHHAQMAGLKSLPTDETMQEVHYHLDPNPVKSEADLFRA